MTIPKKLSDMITNRLYELNESNTRARNEVRDLVNATLEIEERIAERQQELDELQEYLRTQS